MEIAEDENVQFHIQLDPKRPILIYPDDIQNKNLSLGAIGTYCLLQLMCNQRVDWELLYEEYDKTSIDSYLKELQGIGLIRVEGTTIGIRE